MFKQKFKVWDEANQCWAKEKFALLQDGNLMKLDTLEVVYPETHIPSFFTGFLASDKEIYTGDVVQYGYIRTPSLIKTSRSVLAYELDKAKIVGDVFTNPELLEVK